MLLAIPVEGSHYIVDVIAGIAVALLTWVAASALVEAYARERMPRLGNRQPGQIAVPSS